MARKMYLDPAFNSFAASRAPGFQYKVAGQIEVGLVLSMVGIPQGVQEGGQVPHLFSIAFVAQVLRPGPMRCPPQGLK